MLSCNKFNDCWTVICHDNDCIQYTSKKMSLLSCLSLWEYVLCLMVIVLAHGSSCMFHMFYSVMNQYFMRNPLFFFDVFVSFLASWVLAYDMAPWSMLASWLYLLKKYIYRFGPSMSCHLTDYISEQKDKLIPMKQKMIQIQYLLKEKMWD